ncbi:hypothetical protein HT746_01715 [Burkholderia pyrrocinia]|nr:hypothetical protein [Burkholderia pyrrocinia]NTX25874.1 hypothetical protein [Burkholderia pyrrocinia]
MTNEIDVVLPISDHDRRGVCGVSVPFTALTAFTAFTAFTRSWPARFPL